MTQRTRLQTRDRREHILDAAVRVAEQRGYQLMEGGEIAREAKCSHGLLWHYFDSLAELREEVVRRAIRAENLVIVAQVLAARDPLAHLVSASLREAAARAMTE